MDLVFSPKELARAVAPWLAMLLAVIGVGSLAYEALIGRPEALRFSRDGRHLSGTVVHTPVFVDPGARDGGPRNRSLVAINDGELGPQVISIYGALNKGADVPVICLTPARRCMSAADVKERIDLWPLTPIMLAGATELGLAALLAFAARRRRRPHAQPQPAVSV